MTKIYGIIVIIIISIVIIVGILKRRLRHAPIDQTPVACTMDAKICPDGTAVGRIAPNCEFAPCPTV